MTQKSKYFVLGLILLTGCSNFISKTTELTDYQDSYANSSTFKVIFKGKEVPNSEIDLSFVEYAEKNKLTGLETRDTLIDVSFKKWVFRIRQSDIKSVNGKNEIRYDNRIFGNELARHGPFFSLNYFVFDTGLDDIYLMPVKIVK